MIDSRKTRHSSQVYTFNPEGGIEKLEEITSISDSKGANSTVKQSTRRFSSLKWFLPIALALSLILGVFILVKWVGNSSSDTIGKEYQGTGSPTGSFASTQAPTVRFRANPFSDVIAPNEYSELEVIFHTLACENETQVNEVLHTINSLVAFEDSFRTEISCGSIVATIQTATQIEASKLYNEMKESINLGIGVFVHGEINRVEHVKYLTTAGYAKEGSSCIFGAIKLEGEQFKDIQGCQPIESTPYMDIDDVNYKHSDLSFWCPTTESYDKNDPKTKSQWGFCKKEPEEIEMPSSSPSKSPILHSPGPAVHPVENVDPATLSNPPTTKVSLEPTNFPTVAPSNVPSVTPSKFPSGSPSSFPSEIPSNIPSEAPSNFPSVSPLTVGYSGKYSSAKSKKPHVLLIMVDDLGWDDIGYHSGKEYLTPTLDKLAEEGLKLQRMYTQPLCGPSRAALMTGRMQHSTGFGPFTGWNRGYSISGNETLLWEIFKGNGYHNIMVGKFGVGGICDHRYSPLSRGFDNYIGPGSLQYKGYMVTERDDVKSLLPLSKMKRMKGFQWQYAPLTLDTPTWSNRNLYETYTKPPAKYEDRHLTDVFGDETVDAIKNYSQAVEQKKIHSPLMLYLSFRAPHANTRLVPEPPKVTSDTPKELRGKGGNRLKLLQMINAIDRNVARIVSAFKEANLWDDTLTVFISDNGGLATKKGGGSNGHLNGGKGLLWEGGIRVPAFIRGTNSALAQSRHGETSEALMHISDIFPTLVEAASLNMKRVWKCKTCVKHRRNALDGISQWPVWRRKGSEKSQRKHIVHSVKPEHAKFVINEEKVSFSYSAFLPQVYLTIHNTLFDSTAKVHPATYDPDFYQEDNYKGYIERKKTTRERGIKEVQEAIRYNGGVAITYILNTNGEERLLKFMLKSEKRRNPYTGQTTERDGQVRRVDSSNLPDKVLFKYPQFKDIEAFLFDVTTGIDEGERRNLLDKSLNEDYLHALDDILGLVHRYSKICALDMYLARGLTPDIYYLEPQIANGESFWEMPLDVKSPLCKYEEI